MAAHRYWRLLAHSNGGGGLYTLAELTGAIAYGGANVLTGGTASASTTLGSHTAALAFDGNPATYWSSTIDGDQWLAYDLGVGITKDIIEIAISSRNDGFDYQTPGVFDWQYSDDGVNYVTYFNRITPNTWGNPETRIFNTAHVATEKITQAQALVAINNPTIGVRITQADVLTAYTSTALGIRITQAQALVAETPSPVLRVTEAAVLVAVKGRTANPKLRAWTFSLDGHDFYVLRLGILGTLVYDLYSQQWMDWDAFGQIYWPVNVGINWVDGEGVTDAAGNVFGSNVLVGDDTNPLLYILEPTQPYDQASDPLDPQQQNYFPRVLQGQVQMTGRQTLPCYAVWLTTDMGAPAYVGAGVTLEISDDAGVSYQSMGTVSVTPGVNSPELSWTSLGQIQAPGRLFRITDDGAVARIDAMEMNDPDQK